MNFKQMKKRFKESMSGQLEGVVEDLCTAWLESQSDSIDLDFWINEKEKNKVWLTACADDDLATASLDHTVGRLISFKPTYRDADHEKGHLDELNLVAKDMEKQAKRLRKEAQKLKKKWNL